MPLAPHASAAAAAARGGDSGKPSVMQLHAAVKELSAENGALKSALYECRAGMEGLRSAVGALKSELKFVTERLESTMGELKSSTATRVASLSGEMQSTASEVAGLRAQGAAIESSLETVRSELQSHGEVLKEVAIVRAEHSFISSSSNRLEQGFAEQRRIVSDLRAEMAGLSQKHSALSTSTSADQSATQQAIAAIRSNTDTHATQLDVLHSRLSALSGNDESIRAVEKLKKIAKRHEVMLSAVSDAQERSRSELRQLIRQVAEQLITIQDASAAHEEMIEHCCAAINLFAETIRPSTIRRNGTSGFSGGAPFGPAAFPGFSSCGECKANGGATGSVLSPIKRNDRRAWRPRSPAADVGPGRVSPSRAYIEAMRAFRSEDHSRGQARESPRRRRD